MIEVGIEELLIKVKRRLHILHDEEDENLADMIATSIFDLKNKCGDFDVNINLSARELVIERVRYMYNDSLEYFDKNWQSRILELAISLGKDEEYDKTESKTREDKREL